MAKLEEVISTYSWFAPFCECVHRDGTHKGLKKLLCKSIFCDKYSCRSFHMKNDEEETEDS